MWMAESSRGRGRNAPSLPRELEEQTRSCFSHIDKAVMNERCLWGHRGIGVEAMRAESTHGRWWAVVHQEPVGPVPIVAGSTTHTVSYPQILG